MLLSLLLSILVSIVCWTQLSASHSDHLVVLAHGIHGFKTDLTYLSQQLEKAGCVVLKAASNEFMQSQNGIENGAKNIAQEILSLLHSNAHLKRISFVGNSLGGLYTRFVAKELFDQSSGLMAGLRPHYFLTIATPHIGVRNHTFFDEYGIKVPSAFKNIVSRMMGQTGVELLGDDPNTDTDSLLYRMATMKEFLDPLKAFKRRRLLANLNLDMMVPLGTAAFMTPSEVDWHRGAYWDKFGIVSTIYPVCSDRSTTCEADTCSAATGNSHQHSSSLKPVDVMMRSLDSLGWEKVIVNFKGFIPLAHNQIAAVTKFTELIDGMLGFHEGRYLMKNSAEWLTAE